jgi:hypothetical protein
LRDENEAFSRGSRVFSVFNQLDRSTNEAGDIAKMADIEFIGLGIMGRPMAGHILAAGHRLFAHSRLSVLVRVLETLANHEIGQKE